MIISAILICCPEKLRYGVEDDKGGLIRRSFASFPKDVVVQEFKRQDGEKLRRKYALCSTGRI